MFLLDERHDLVRMRHVRLRGSADAVHARQRFEAAVSRVDASSLGLPAHALLVVRRLSPRAQLLLDYPRASDAFHRAVSGELLRCAQTARRPWLSGFAPAENAVWFSDDAELVACLVRDWLRGAVHDRWWWHAVLSGAPVAAWLRQHVLSRGELLVPVVAVLATDGIAVPLIARLDDHEVSRALDAVARAYDAPRASAGASATVAPATRREAADQRDALATAVNTADRMTQSRGRLLSTVPELLGTALRLPQLRLLAWACVAARAPGWLRTEELAHTVDRWLVTRGDGVVPRERALPQRAVPHSSELLSNAGTRDAAPHAELTLRPANDATRTMASSRESGSVHTRARMASGGRALAVAPVRSARSSASTRAIPREEDMQNCTAHDTQHVARRETSRARSTLTAPAGTAHIGEQSASRDIAAITARTQFGGIFYLLTALIALELYGDFTTPRTLGIALSPWDLLALIGRQWFGVAFIRDPVWTVLATLAGRDAADEPGQHFDAPHAWRIGETWLTPWGDLNDAHERSTRTRRRVMHAAGFAIIDVPRRSQRTAVTARFATRRWLRWLLAYLDARLTLALGVDNPSDVLCRHSARVTATVSAVDIHLELAHLPLSVRFAGLDRNVGWLPAGGRSVSFHFA